MPHNPLISVIIPVYNVAKYLPTCLESVLEQTYQNLQVIVVNDGSPDNSLEITESYTDSRLKVVSKPNGGLSSARNYGLRFARGDYLCFVDSDDVLHPDYLRFLLAGIQYSSADLSICALARFSTDTDLPSLTGTLLNPEWAIFPRNEAISHLYSGDIMGQLTVACSKLYPRKIYEGLSFPEGRIHEDVAVALSVLLQTDHIAVTSAPLYLYRRNDSSIMTTPSWNHIDGVDFYEEHFHQLSSLGSPHAKLALLAAFKAGLTCLAEYSTDPNFKGDVRYRQLQQRIQKLSWQIPLKNLRNVDIATILTTRISITAATAIYRKALRYK